MRICSRAAAVCLLALFLSGSTARSQIILYTQPSNFPIGTVFASQNDVGGLGNFATAYDNFTLLGPSTVTDVTWQGGFFNGGHGNITGFTLSFWSTVGGLPGALLGSFAVAGNANEAFVGNEFFGPVYDYSTNLGGGFVAAAGTQYWMSVVPDMPFPPQWGWHTGTGGDGLAAQDFLGSRNRLNNDFAFTLKGQVVPEGGSVALFAAGVVPIGFAVLRRRRKV